MDLFDLFAKIQLDTSEYEEGIERARKGASDYSSGIKGAGEQTDIFGSVMKANLASSVIEKGFSMAVSGAKKLGQAVVDMGKQAVGGFADYEQLVGGVETLFKDSADIVIGYAENAYQTAGLSANAYMETVTSFSASLLQSLGNDTQAAAEKADMAITDMADNANKLGTDMTAIQNAYQGFAKQNYTMLDNLKIGYGGTKEEMERLLEDAEAIKAAQGEVAEYSIDSYADIVDAIHVVQTEMGITGTTAEEASETISGSISSAKAAYENFLTGLADENADLGGLFENLGDSIVTVFSNVGPAVANVMTAPIRAIEQATDPINKVKKAIEGIEEAQANAAATNQISDLVDQYEALRAKSQDASLSERERAAVEEELTGIMEALSEATNGAIPVTEEFTEATDAAVEAVKTLNQEEQKRKDTELYAELTKGTEAYQEALYSQMTVENELAEAQEHQKATSENMLSGAASGYQKVADAIAALRDESGESIFDTSTIKGAEAMEAALSDIEDQIYNLTGDKVAFDGIAQAEAYMEELSVSTGDVADATLDAGQSVEELQAKYDALKATTEAYESSVISLVQSGFLSQKDACELLGISEDALQHKIRNLEAGQIAAANSSQSLAEEHLEEAEAAKAAAEAEEKATKTLGEIGLAAYDAIEHGTGLRETYEKLEKQMEDLEEAGSDEIALMASQALAMLNLAATSEELMDSYSGYVNAAENAGVSISDLSYWLIENSITAEEWGGRVDSATDGVINSFQKVDTSLDMSLSTMASNMQANISAYQNWNNNISQLMKAAVSTGNQSAVDFVNYMAEMGIGAASQVQQMVDNIGYTMETFPALMEQAADQGMVSVYNEVENGKVNVSDATSGMMDGAVAEIEGADLKTPMAGKGTEMAQGLSGSQSEVETAAHDAAMAAHSAVSQIGWTDLGQAIANGISGGMLGNLSALETAGTSAAEAAKTAAQAVKGWENVGYNMAAGIAQGMKNGSALVKSAATQAVNAAVEAAKEAGKIHSPSEVTEDEVGFRLTEGTAKGMVNDKAMAALADSADTVITYLTDRMRGIDLSIEAINTIQSDRDAERELKQHNEKLAELQKKYDEAAAEDREDIRKEILEEQEDWSLKQLEKQEEAQKAALKAEKETMEDVLEIYQEGLRDFSEEFQDRMEEVLSERADFQNKMASFGQLFSYDNTDFGDFMVLGNLEEQTKAIEEYGRMLEELQARGIDESLMQEILGLDLQDAWNYGSRLLSMSDESYDAYMESWQRKQETAASIAERFYRDDLESLRTEYTDKIPAALEGLKTEMEDLGTESALALAEAFAAQEDTIGETWRRTVENAYAQAAAIVATPIYSGSGSVTTEDLYRATAGAVNGISAAMAGSASGDLKIQINVDGQRFYTATMEDFRTVAKANPEVVSDE